jgi:LPS-assembly protein
VRDIQDRGGQAGFSPMRRGMRALMVDAVAALALTVLLIALPAGAAEPQFRTDLPVALIADAVEYDTASGRVTASGHVEVYYGERTLTADRIVYDSTTERITAEGPLVLRDSSGATVFADFAELDTELRNGLVRGARAVMKEHVRLSAAEARRVEGRFNVLTKAVYSPCKVCADNPTPLWRVRAKRVIHDETEKVIHYEDATLEVFGVPIAWLPYFSHPDPTAERQSGFLVPQFQHSTLYGFAAQVPYYWVIDDYSDLTFAPLITTGDGVIGTLEYRRRLKSGDFQFAGSGTFSDYQGRNEFHGHLQGKGEFDLSDGLKWGFDGTVVTDRDYLRRYDFSDKDRLTSELYVRRYNRQGFFDATAVYFQSLREDEPAGEIPVVLPDFSFRHELPEAVLGGDVGLFASATVLLRDVGLSTNRLSIGVDWDRQTILPSGVVLRGFAEARGDWFITDGSSGFDSSTETRLAPLAGVELRYPLTDTTSGGVIHVLEPIGQAILAPYGGNGKNIPNDDSLVTEFDETNLFDTSHFSGLDAFEEGPRLNLGLRYERIAPNGLNFDASVGRVLRPRDADEFSAESGLRNAVSDWVGAWSASYDPYVTVRHRLRVSDDLSITRNEIGAQFSFDRFDLEGQYTFLEKDPTIDAPQAREELAGSARIRLNHYWWLTGHARRDLRRDKFVTVGGGLIFANECCQVDFRVRRQFTKSDHAPESTTFAVLVKLFTLGNEDTTTP